MKKILLIAFFAASLQLALAQVPRKVLIEQFTGTWCGFCPNAIELIDQTVAEYPANAIAISNHGPNVPSDTMSNAYVTLISNDYYAPSGSYSYPGVMIDRVDWSAYSYTFPNTPEVIDGSIEGAGNNNIADATAIRINASSPVKVDIAPTYNSASRSVSAKITATFSDTLSGSDLRLVCLIVEDSVMGPAHFNQDNYLGKTCAHAYSPSIYYNYPCTIPTSLTGKTFVHRNVVRDNMCGVNYTWGSVGVIPASVVIGQAYSKTYTYTLPAAWNEKQMKIVAFVAHYNTTLHWDDEVLNAEQAYVIQSVTGIPENTAAANNASLDAVYPNPFSDVTNIKVNIPYTQHVSLKVLDILGREVATLADGSLTQGAHVFNWNGKSKNGTALSNGLYLVRLQTEKQNFSRSIVYQKN